MKKLTLAVLLALGVPLPALAQSEDEDLRELTQVRSTVEAGVGYVDEDARKFGEYTGLDEKGAYFLGGVDMMRRTPTDTYYWILRGRDLGLASRNLFVESGRQGSWRVWGEYDELPKYGEAFLTPFLGVGSGHLTLPSGFEGLTTADTANTPAGFALRESKVNPFLQEAHLEQERTNYKFGVGGQLTKQLSANASFRREDKEGLKLFGGVVGNSGGNPRAILVPEPVDYSTTHLEATLAWRTPALQLEGGWYQSKFENDHKALTWQNPFAAITGWAPAAGFPTGFGQAALPPDNEYNRLSLQGGYNFTSHTRVSFTFERGRMEQNDAFLPYTVNPALTVAVPLPRESADARIDSTIAAVNFSAQPLRKLHLHAQFRYEDFDNKTPQATYVYIGGDSTNQATPGLTDRTRVNLPLSTTKTVYKLGGNYEFLPRTKLKFAYDYDEDERTFAEVDKNKQHLVMLGVRRSLTDGVNGEVSWSRSERTGADNWCYNCAYLTSFAPGFTGPQAANNTNWDNLPLLRRFNYANRDRDKIRFQLTASPHEAVQLQVFADYIEDDYTDTVIGLQKGRTGSLTAEASFTPSERLSGHVFYTRDRAKYEQWGRSFNSASKPTAGFAESTPNDWFNSGEDEGDTFGIGGRFVVIPKVAEVGLDASYSKMVGRISTETGPGLTPAGLPLPDLHTKLKVLQVYGKYQVRRDLALKLSWWYQKLETNDWQWDTFGPVGIPNVITAGTVSPDYAVNFVGLTAIYQFR